MYKLNNSLKKANQVYAFIKHLIANGKVWNYTMLKSHFGGGIDIALDILLRDGRLIELARGI